MELEGSAVKREYNYTPLPEPIPIADQHWPEGTMPVVCTRTLTYNHKDYIRECIDGILMQKTTFPVRVLVHDDASTDGTAEIVREYEKKYPQLIKAYCQKENIYRAPDRHERRATFHSWRIGKYEAPCEGDDFWTDTNKLQFQVGFLEEHPDFMGTSHNVNYLNDPDNEVNMDREFYGEMRDSIYTLKDVENGACVAGAFCSFVFRNFITKEFLDKMKSPDFPQMNHIGLSIWLAIQGNVYYSKKVMATHRYIMRKGSSNWKSQSISINNFGILYDLFLKLEKAAWEEFGVKLDLHKSKYAHFYQMVKRAFTSFKKSDFKILVDTWKKSGNRARYFFLIFYSLTYDAARSIRKTIKRHLLRG